MKRRYIGAVLIALIAVLAIALYVMDRKSAVQAAATQIPKFEVDPMWPKPLPNHWIMGNIIGVTVDSKDHIWLIHRRGSRSKRRKFTPIRILPVRIAATSHRRSWNLTKRAT